MNGTVDGTPYVILCILVTIIFGTVMIMAIGGIYWYFYRKMLIDLDNDPWENEIQQVRHTIKQIKETHRWMKKEHKTNKQLADLESAKNIEYSPKKTECSPMKKSLTDMESAKETEYNSRREFTQDASVESTKATSEEADEQGFNMTTNIAYGVISNKTKCN